MDRESSPIIKAERLDTPPGIIVPIMVPGRVDTPPLIKSENPEPDGRVIPPYPSHPEDPCVTATTSADINASIKRRREDSPVLDRPLMSYQSFSLQCATSNCVASQQGAEVNPLFKGLLPVIISLKVNDRPENRGSVPLGYARLEDWSPEKIVFTFGLLGIDAHLSPHFDIRLVGKALKKVHCTLAFFGHTVSTEASINTEHEAKIMACLKALKKLKPLHPWWTVPHMPMGREVDSDGDWKKLLADYCAEHEQCQPVYGPLCETGAGWHCDVAVKHRVFCTAASASSRQKAQNAAAHTVLYQLLVGDDCPAQGQSSPVRTRTEGWAGRPAPRSRHRGESTWRRGHASPWWRRFPSQRRKQKKESKGRLSPPFPSADEVQVKLEPDLTPPRWSPPPLRKKKKGSGAREDNPNLTPLGPPRF